ncbi:unnamed protein product [Nippostrongylus brasiliensis]|uniref:BPI2 domain-containing protein n=1 Tax=Nippostrongylus brasiliensis TaxID=27835 RepID=A0A0N4Y9J6_NIPBR|nr:unnamed protein product [Nippostrongylus brasiliensis]
MLLLFLLLFILPYGSHASELGATFGDAAVSQLVRHAAAKMLQEPKIAEITLKTQESPSLGSLAHLEILNQVAYKNLSVVFHDRSLHVVVDRLSLLSHSNLSEVLWPFGLGEQAVDIDLQLHRAEIRLDADETTFSLGECLLIGSELAASVPGHWIADRGASAVAALLSPVFDSVLCNALQHHIGSLEANTVMLKSVKVDDHRLTARAQLEWVEITETPPVSLLDETANITLLEMELNADDVVTVWLEDGIINELLGQVDWNFEWMNEQLPVTSPVIPPDSSYIMFLSMLVDVTKLSFREFLTTLCTECYFQVNVGARGRPSLTATNSSLMEVGAFPKSWGIFMQDLMRGMIMDMLWPEIKNAIEELSYGKGVQISRACGVDPNEIRLDIGEGNFALTSRLALQHLDIERCIKDLKTSLPTTSKIFNKID